MFHYSLFWYAPTRVHFTSVTRWTPQREKLLKSSTVISTQWLFNEDLVKRVPLISTGLKPFGEEQHCIQVTGKGRPSSSPFFMLEAGKVRLKISRTIPVIKLNDFPIGCNLLMLKIRQYQFWEAGIYGYIYVYLFIYCVHICISTQYIICAYHIYLYIKYLYKYIFYICILHVISPLWKPSKETWP